MDGSETDLRKMKVRDLMTSNPIVVDPDVTIERVMALMQQAEIRHVPVVDDRGILGVVSDRDLSFLHGLPGVIEKLDEELEEEILDAPISVALKSRFLVERDVVTIPWDASAKRAVNVLLGTKVGALPVVDDQREVVGVLSTVDVMRWVADVIL